MLTTQHPKAGNGVFESRNFNQMAAVGSHHELQAYGDLARELRSSEQYRKQDKEVSAEYLSKWAVELGDKISDSKTWNTLLWLSRARSVRCRTSAIRGAWRETEMERKVEE